jgi:hypothetical protein
MSQLLSLVIVEAIPNPSHVALPGYIGSIFVSLCFAFGVVRRSRPSQIQPRIDTRVLAVCDASATNDVVSQNMYDLLGTTLLPALLRQSERTHDSFPAMTSEEDREEPIGC